MCFTGGLTLDRQQLQHGGFGSLTDTIFSFASSLKIMEVDDLEYAALSAVCLVSNGKLSNHISGVVVNKLTSSAVDFVFVPRSG